MNVIFDGNVIVHFRIEEIPCYYLCSHIYKTFIKRKNSGSHVSILKDSETNEMIIYCNDCKKFHRGLFLFNSLN